MILLRGGDLVLEDQVLAAAALRLDGNSIVAIGRGADPGRAGGDVIDVTGHLVVPGFVDVHVHGVLGHDTLDGAGALGRIAAALPRYGVTAFCPTTVACDPEALRTLLADVATARRGPAPGSARVLPAHLESNFINPEYCGAQPVSCLRLPPTAEARDGSAGHPPEDPGGFTGQEILEVIGASRPDVGIVTLAPELPGGLDLVRHLSARGHRVSLGHSAADFETAHAAFDAGATHVTHLFNRMTPLMHRAPGLVGAALERDEVAAEIICDGFHVHPAVARMAIAVKGAQRVMAITDGTGGSGLAPGAHARLGGRRIRVGEHAAFLDDGTLAGSTLTMEDAFRRIVRQFGRSVVEAALMCATTPARRLGLADAGVIREGAVADLTVLDRSLSVVLTLVGGTVAYRAPVSA